SMFEIEHHPGQMYIVGQLWRYANDCFSTGELPVGSRLLLPENGGCVSMSDVATLLETGRSVFTSPDESSAPLRYREYVFDETNHCPIPNPILVRAFILARQEYNPELVRCVYSPTFSQNVRSIIRPYQHFERTFFILFLGKMEE
ncbi:MAG: hypothetical protein LIP23_00075, partial [Planctomycetes bacterium]|nr:hypothetical protein [Planctomycetota bacterium]